MTNLVTWRRCCRVMGHYQELKQPWRLRQIKRHSKETFAQWWLFYDNCFLLVYYIYYWQITLQVDWRARRRIKNRHWQIYCWGFTLPLKPCVWKFRVVVVDYVKEFYLSACGTRCTIIFQHSTNQIIVFWCWPCRCRRLCLKGHVTSRHVTSRHVTSRRLNETDPVGRKALKC